MNKVATVGQLRKHVEVVGGVLSAILSELASGKYSDEIAIIEGSELMKVLTEAFPPVAQAEMAFNALIWLNKVTAPRGPVVPDGMGGWVPASNSRYDPKTGRFL